MKYLSLIALLVLGCSPNKSTPTSNTAKSNVPNQKAKVEQPQAKKDTKPVAKPKAKTAIGDPRFVIQFPKPSEAPKTTHVKVLPLADYKMNLEYPASLNLDKGLPASDLAGKRQEPTSLTEAALDFKMPIKSDKELTMKAVIDFSVCNAQACEMIEKEITWTAKPGT